jgi:uncharacterized protein YsxB (DUF464 family)
MIRASAVLSPGGTLLAFTSAGHADTGPRGSDIVCAAFSVLARTSFRALEGLAGIELRGSALEPGSLCFEVLKPADSTERAAGIADFLVAGIGDLARDYPDAVEFVIKRDWRE